MPFHVAVRADGFLLQLLSSEWNTGNFNHAVTGQALDENHAKHDCTSCHKENAFGKAPSCDDCHDEGEGISFPQKRPGPLVRNKGVQQ